MAGFSQEKSKGGLSGEGAGLGEAAMEGREGRSDRHPFGPWPGVSIHFLSREMGARGGNRGRGKEGRPLCQLGPAIQS